MERINIIELRPKWLSGEDRRYGLGVSILCPGHLGDDHRVELYFTEPLDGLEPQEGVPAEQLVRRLPSIRTVRDIPILLDLTLAPSMGDEDAPVEVPGHWRGWVVDGLFTRVAEPPEGARPLRRVA